MHTGYAFYQKILRSPQCILGPMVGHSEQAWRILCRRYNAELCFTPMYHARLFSDPFSGPKYREEQWSTDKEDRPLIVQFCANDPDTLARAADLVQDQCDAIDLNLGCPQHIAKRGHYGSFLQDDWDLVSLMISRLHRHLSVPVTAKIRVFESISKTVEYARMIRDAGASILTVHGRTREQKGHHTGLADWAKIKAVKEALDIPVIANGNILFHDDIDQCMAATGADGVMSAEALLHNPALFSRREHPPLTWEMAWEYLDICQRYPTRPSVIKSHFFKLFHASLPIHTDLRASLGQVKTIDDIVDLAHRLRDRLETDRLNYQGDTMWIGEDGHRRYPHWYCQPSIRSIDPTLSTTIR